MRTAAAPVYGCESAPKENDLHAPRPTPPQKLCEIVGCLSTGLNWGGPGMMVGSRSNRSIANCHCFVRVTEPTTFGEAVRPRNFDFHVDSRIGAQPLTSAGRYSSSVTSTIRSAGMRIVLQRQVQ